MASKISLHDCVALLEETPAKHFHTGDRLLLRRGQVGTVVMVYPEGRFEVEFAGRDGRAYAVLTLPEENLMVLRDAPEVMRT